MSSQITSNSRSIATQDQPQTTMPVTLIDWRPIRRNTLRGYAKVLLGSALMIADVPVNVTNGRSWAALPSKPIVIDGRHAVDDAGKPLYQPVLEWASTSARNRFSAAVVAAVLQSFPAALSDDRSWP